MSNLYMFYIDKGLKPHLENHEASTTKTANCDHN